MFEGRGFTAGLADVEASGMVRAPLLFEVGRLSFDRVLGFPRAATRRSPFRFGIVQRTSRAGVLHDAEHGLRLPPSKARYRAHCLTVSSGSRPRRAYGRACSF